MRGRIGLMIGVLTLAALGASGAWWRWGRSPTPLPAAIDLSKAEEEVRSLIEGARERVENEPRSAEETARRIASHRTSPEGQEGLRAFLEKRAPTWRKKNGA